MKTLKELQNELQQDIQEADPFRRLNAKEMGALKRGEEVRLSYIPRGKVKSVSDFHAKVHSNQGGSWSYKLSNGKMISQLRVDNHQVFKKNIKEMQNELEKLTEAKVLARGTKVREIT